MPDVKVTFDRIDVVQDGDPGATDGRGDFYWGLDVNGDRISERLRSDPLQMGTGGTINLGDETSVELQSDEELVVSGYLADNDQGLSGQDEHDDFRHTYDESENWGDGPHTVTFNERDMSCTLHYRIHV
jgi:hypothetical protein